jgi:hypothetical protein
MQDIVISAISNYEFDKLECWVNSLELTGYKGRKGLIVFNILDSTIDELKSRGFEIFLTTDRRNSRNDGYLFQDNFTFQVPAARHWFNWSILRHLKNIRYVISTDVDVIFQSDPSEWLENNLGEKKLNYGCEGLKYKDEAWGNSNIESAMGSPIHDYMKERPIYNAGSMAGEFQTFIDFSLVVYLAIQHSRNAMPDQAGVNTILSLEPYKSITKFNDHDTNWACQCGTTVDPSKIDSFRPHLLSPEPVFDGSHVFNSKGDKYVLVHQYNRVPEWDRVFNKMYRS